MNKEPTGMMNGLTNDGDRGFSLYLWRWLFPAPCWKSR